MEAIANKIKELEGKKDNVAAPASKTEILTSSRYVSCFLIFTIRWI